MRVIVTCGPGYEPIDQVRRITNFSTGELGLLLASGLARAGHDVTCLRGDGATSQVEPGGARVVSFSTGGNLLDQLETFAGTGCIDAVFHAAALCDFRVKTVRGTDGTIQMARKFATVNGELTLTLEPALKLLPRFRNLFPKARLVGWKFDLDGTRDDATTRARRQLEECRTNACVVNGGAWGAGFGFIEPGKNPVPSTDKASLCTFLVDWLVRNR